MSTFNNIVRITIDIEGGYNLDPKDPGGETRYGISKRAYPDLDIKGLTLPQAIAIYRRDYWEAGKCEDLPRSLRHCFFDTCVHSGISQATKLLQQAVGTKKDGVLGPKTCAAVNNYPGDVVAEFMTQRLLFAMKLKNWEHVKTGWIRRFFKVINLKDGK